MKPRLLSCRLLICLAVVAAAYPSFATSPGINVGQDRLEKRVEDGWTLVAPDVMQRRLSGNKVETFAWGPKGFSWRVRELQAQLEFLRNEARLHPTPELRQVIREQREQIRKLREYLRLGFVEPTAPAVKAGCNFFYMTHADAYPAEPTDGTRAAADAYYKNDCASTGTTYAYAYAKATLNGTTTTVTQTDSDTGSAISSYAAASADGSADCYSYSYALMYDYAQGISSASADESFVCAPAGPPIFSDVPIGFWARRHIEAIYFAGITGGCARDPLRYCPGDYVSRAQAAVFLITAKGPAGYVPPACTTPIFADVPCTYWAAPWINEFARRGITVGCGGGNYCPEVVVDRGTMAYFILATLGVPAPTACTGMFSDVPCTVWYAPWVEELARRGITVGCGAGQYCPSAPVDRSQMAVFLARAFNIPMP